MLTAMPLSGLQIDRMSERREDGEWIAELWRSESSLVLPVAQGRIPVRSQSGQMELGLIPRSLLNGVEHQSSYSAFLGMLDGQAYFSVAVDQQQSDLWQQNYSLRFRGLRSMSAVLSQDQLALAAYARGLDLWQSNHRYCGRCGHAVDQDQAGFRLKCGHCGLQHFPRLDPAIIVIVTDGDRCLLGRQASWPERRYSTLAGFVEPGESLEEAVVREVQEESGVRVHNVRYLSSQPWPFPSSLMVGFEAEATDPTIQIGEELEEARWFEGAKLPEYIQSGELILSPPTSISFHLLNHWAGRRHGLDLLHLSRESWS